MILIIFIIGLNLCIGYIPINKSNRLVNRIIEKDLRNADSCFKINKPFNKFFTTCFPEEDDNKKKKLIKKMIGDELYFTNFETVYKNEYTLIWYNCNECRKLLDVMDELKLSNIYINGESFFHIDYFEPLLFKNDEFFSDNLDDIYKEIYSNN